MPWRWDIAERDHELQNPTSVEKVRLLGDYLRLTPESRVLDIACGKAGPALVLAQAYGCRLVGVERLPEFADAARRRVAESDLDGQIEIQTGDAREFALEAESWDAALCYDDWDRYESLHWRAIEEWLAEQPDDEFRAHHTGYRRNYVRYERELLGWAIFVGRKS